MAATLLLRHLHDIFAFCSMVVVQTAEIAQKIHSSAAQMTHCSDRLSNATDMNTKE